MPFVKPHKDYYKYDYQDWTQPILTSNTSYGTLTSSGVQASQLQPYSALNGVASGAPSDMQGWINGASTGWWKWELPVKLSISAIKFYNPYCYYDVSTSGQFFIDEGITPLTEAFSTGNSDWASYDLTVINNTPTNVIYFKKTGKGTYGGIGELKITAREQISVAGTEADHDYHIDRNKMYQLTAIERTYYKYVYQDWTQPVLTANDSDSSFVVSASSELEASFAAWKSFDGVIDNVCWISASVDISEEAPQYYYIKTDTPLKIYSISVTNRIDNYSHPVTKGVLQASVDGDSWIDIVQINNDIISSGATWVIEANETVGYRHHRIKITDYYLGGDSSKYVALGHLVITAQKAVDIEVNVKGFDIYQDWTQPVLSANGTMGGDSFAVSSNVAQYSGQGVYKLFDSDTSGCFHSTSGVTTGYIDLYNPKALKITNILVNNQNSGGAENRASASGNIYGSYNGSDWEEITSYTNTVQGINEQWNIDLSSNNKAYRYYRIESTAGGTGGYWTIGELTITAQELVAVGGTVEDADYYTGKIINHSPMTSETKYYKYWEQPVNPSGITATSGWSNVANAFDDSADTYATCGTSTDYIEYDFGEDVFVNGITATGNWASSVSRAMGLRIYSVVNDVEVLLGITNKPTDTTTYNLSASFNPVYCSRIRVRLAEENSNGDGPTTSYPTRIRNITIQGALKGTSSDYDYYERKIKMY